MSHPQVGLTPNLALTVVFLASLLATFHSLLGLAGMLALLTALLSGGALLFRKWRIFRA